MISDDRQAQVDIERRQLRDAIRRLLDGAAQRSNGRLTVSTLAAEAGVSRQRLYEHHADLISEFKAAAGGGPVSPNVEALQRQLAAAQDKIQQLERTNTALQGRITTLSAVIVELTHEAHADNVVALPPRRRRRDGGHTTRP